MGQCFQEPFKRPGASRRLVFFHHAGGSSLSFMRLVRSLPARYQVMLAEMPGRGFRHGEPPCGSLKEFAGEAVRELKENSSLPTTLFGHSMGAMVAHEAALRWGDGLERLVVSACRAPGQAHGRKDFLERTHYSDADLLEYISGYGQLPQEMGGALDGEEARAYFLPVLRGDLALIKGYEASCSPVSCPLLAIGGEADQMVSPEDLSRWGNFTPAFEQKKFPGGHFFLWEYPSTLAALF
jgi:pyochelin biosynthetic protein PchC